MSNSFLKSFMLCYFIMALIGCANGKKSNPLLNEELDSVSAVETLSEKNSELLETPDLTLLQVKGNVKEIKAMNPLNQRDSIRTES